MELTGRVHAGTIIFDSDPALPEGAEVRVVYPVVSKGSAANRSGANGLGGTQRVQLPLVSSRQPASVNLTNQRIAEIMDAEDESP